MKNPKEENRGVSTTENRAESKIGPLIALILLVIFTWLGFGIWLAGDPNRGTFGDMFGSVSALFSGLAFAGLIYTILLQRAELRLQRNELVEQKEQLFQQNRTTQKQNFENTFFQLLNLHRDIVRSIDLRDSNSKIIATGRDCFLNLYQKKFRQSYSQAVQEDPARDEGSRIERAYAVFHQITQSDVGHYFRNLYHIVKFASEIDVGNKQFYLDLVMAQLSSYELALLFYNGLGPLGKRNFKPLIEQYGLLENLDKTIIINQSHLTLYSESAFGKR